MLHTESPAPANPAGMGCHDLDFTIHNADFCHEKAQKAQNVIEDAP
jgi:hypothetical protein